ncbi:MAG: prepilin-type N-terminal cleavage/methylation domain-containing protein [Planctomycetes bacterium]|nr:prepilin-type N-terminal cleavage/methylation domain-containing protein [Planctomycetota bacterium]MBU1517608.1 prepilin-type N-terminal cleavage/methylation domain-containing protein [Planctomycetota bacterium]MBU2457306.1 prepilin-type N-terminal cleavage/methylation domain-containing protein [Planctomycetota bacterium]MBU2596599.1 prepilin-type N-terminal cleavage/methylation domain-containing protein [Planctomycetota bacterium]
MKRNQNTNGLTIVEILVAIAIVAILAAGLYSVGNYVETQSKIKLTESTIETLVTALDEYHDFYGKFPDPNADSEYLTGCDLSVEKLYYKLGLAPGAKKILGHINTSLIKDANSDGFREVVDAWGTDFGYDYKTSYNFPVITSAGPDRDFGVTDPNNAQDNITSR